MPDAPLTFTQAHPGGRILLMMGQHEVGAVFPPVIGERNDFATPWRWTFWLNGSRSSAKEGRAKSELAAKNALLAEAREWLQKAGVG